MTNTLLSLGHGFSASALADVLLPEGWQVIGTTRSADKLERLAATGVTPILWQADAVAEALERATHLLISAAPDAEGDPALRLIGPQIARRAPALKWAGYLSTTGVYGDHAGGWVDEETPLAPSSRRGQMRVSAEQAWAGIPGLPLHIFRLAGIYGPGRGPFAKLRKGTARRIIKPNQVFSRIHVEDIAQVLRASIARPKPGAIYNLCDDAPAPPQDVIACAAEMLGMPVPPEVPFDEAEMSPMARSFYGESKRVSNTRIKKELGVTLRYPDYQSALAAILAAEQAPE
ncbi:SDR family oxidoreductase [Antarctobacter heliothermus]|uniref:Nucleoside-diphosphate-sugar epimerase n=1 Tax=Antarctobacter heliothermus TaxID=74033 RepID=A0A239HJW3_9RHOB|nr:SDR family oxidoreductase [Antarctobacter heliothermus]SNS81689.1 Nucleoside-diphosphate-sugar epimerase [Antarctobacter heliothermus]